MKITFIRGTALGGVGNDAYPGDVRDIPEVQARQFIAQGRAVAGGIEKKPAEVSPRSADPQGTAGEGA